MITDAIIAVIGFFLVVIMAVLWADIHAAIPLILIPLAITLMIKPKGHPVLITVGAIGLPIAIFGAGAGVLIGLFFVIVAGYALLKPENSQDAATDDSESEA